MTNQEIANEYVALIREGKHGYLKEKFYSDDIVCTEPEHAAAFGVATVTRGIEAVNAKFNARKETIAEQHSAYCSDAVVGGNYFSVAMGRDITFKNGKRIQTNEIGVFGIKDEKIVSETFFY